MKKRLFILTIAFILVICCCVMLHISAWAERDGLYTYKINDDMTVTITHFDWNNNHGDIYIPEMLGNRMVSAIGDKAFATSENEAVSITLPDNIKSIGALAFKGVSIKYINIPLNTIEIGYGAFCQCSVMQFRVANGHAVFATIDNALYNKKEKTLIAWPLNKELEPIPNGIVKIDDYVFYGRDYIEPAEGPHFLPDTLTEIGKYAFAEAEFSGHINKVSIIDDYAFYRGTCDYKDPGVHFTDDTPQNFSHIGAHAFENCYRVELPIRGISYIPCEVGDYAFYNTELYSKQSGSYTSLNNITSVGQYAFSTSGEHSNTGFELWYGDELSYIGEGAFYKCAIYQEVKMGNISVISKKAFEDTYIDEIKFPETVKCIESDAFKDNRFLEKASLNNGLETIESGAFRDCPKLTDISIPETVLSIGDEVFKGCTSLTGVSIPASVNYIGNNVFDDCSDKLVIVVEAGSYGEVWARTCGYSYRINGKEDDTSWLSD